MAILPTGKCHVFIISESIQYLWPVSSVFENLANPLISAKFRYFVLNTQCSCHSLFFSSVQEKPVIPIFLVGLMTFCGLKSLQKLQDFQIHVILLSSKYQNWAVVTWITYYYYFRVIPSIRCSAEIWWSSSQYLFVDMFLSRFKQEALCGTQRTTYSLGSR